MASVRNIPVVTSEPPFKAMLPLDQRILYIEHVPFIPECKPSAEGSSSGASSGSSSDS